ncbi:CaiB/BaiF CoA transferase family protein [Cytobacillus purgationiresistens]|uniref:Formyl-CoA transferase/CoA:oxalate CoA-transferase n=1 Tax=Cytobacillus purgationiresistens TaxID=863449 RepID=A0ABU0AFV2_9BACI|nr:CaiB/BaiF CoA-transferase family protein [Cytobacillus purgationiresistens]MDQ0269662.1 formyl-CoA transferase/CoA:oxalate CoA-transferase [Cytobacillus purgationiresistens]
MAGPLTGVKVIDVTTNISGPTLTMVLADLGAEIIKIERPDVGDDARGMGPFIEGEGVYFLHINRNKQSIVIDLKQDEGKEIVYDLVKNADIFVENFRLNKAEKMGLGFNRLKEVNSALIYCSLSAYGQEGPLSDRPGYDAIAQADAGIIGINGAEGAEIARVPVSILDQGSAMWGVVGILSAMLHKEKTGEGQHVTTSLYETGVFWTGYHMLSYLATGKEPKKNGAGHTAFAPYGAFLASDTHLMIGISNNSLFKRLCSVLGKDEWLDDPRYSSNQKRVENQSELKTAIENILYAKIAGEWVELLAKSGVPSSKVKKISEVVEDEQTKATNMWSDLPHAKIENLKLPRLPFELSQSPTEMTQGPPLLGANTVNILSTLGYSKNQIQQLKQNGIIQAAEKQISSH